jgi:hypothetical protein
VNRDLVLIARAAPIVTPADLMEVQTVRHHEMFCRNGLRPLPGRDLPDIPVYVDHDKSADPVGYVTALREDECWTGGSWLWVHARITNPPAWLTKDTGVSICYAPYDKHTPWGASWELINRGFLKELSLLRPGVRPAHPRAQVTWIGKPEPSAATTTPNPPRPPRCSPHTERSNGPQAAPYSAPRSPQTRMVKRFMGLFSSGDPS